MTIKLKTDETQQTQQTQVAATDSTNPKGATNVKVGYVLSPITPSTYNAIYYADPNQTLVNTFWEADRVSSLSLAGLGVEVGLGDLDPK